ncbi:MAG TPA: site-specific integrase [Microvirga sp.]|nr:site-specific integrase [Microvirga sp.]
MLSVYLDEVVPKQASPARVAARITRLIDWWGAKLLSEVTPATCRAYAAERKRGGSRRDLEDLRAAINHHAKRELHTGYIEVELPAKGEARSAWLTRDEAARLLWACWRHGRTVRLPRGREKGKVVESEWHDLRHIARFILMGLYTGSRSGAIFSASIYAGANRSFVDLDSGIFYRLAEGKAETNKRQPPAPIPGRLLAHLRRWKAKGIIAQYVVEWDGKPIKSVKVGWKRAVQAAGLTHKRVTPHTLRHTAATWLMQQGVDPWEAAGYLGMSEQMLRDTYGHHHPAFMRNAAERITRKRSR